jgi:hypothetical protein
VLQDETTQIHKQTNMPGMEWTAIQCWWNSDPNPESNRLEGNPGWGRASV